MVTSIIQGDDPVKGASNRDASEEFFIFVITVPALLLR